MRGWRKERGGREREEVEREEVEGEYRTREERRPHYSTCHPILAVSDGFCHTVLLTFAVMLISTIDVNIICL